MQYLVDRFDTRLEAYSNQDDDVVIKLIKDGDDLDFYVFDDSEDIQNLIETLEKLRNQLKHLEIPKNLPKV